MLCWLDRTSANDATDGSCNCCNSRRSWSWFWLALVSCEKKIAIQGIIERKRSKYNINAHVSPSPTLSFCFDRISQLLSVVAVVSYSTPICDTRASLCQVTRGCITIAVLEAQYSRDWKLGPLLLPPPQAWFSRRSGAYGLQNLSTVGKPVHTNEVKKKTREKERKTQKNIWWYNIPFFFPAVLVHRMRSLKVAANWMDKQRASHHGKESWTFHNMGRSVVNMKTRKKKQ